MPRCRKDWVETAPGNSRFGSISEYPRIRLQSARRREILKAASGKSACGIRTCGVEPHTGLCGSLVFRGADFQGFEERQIFLGEQVAERF